MEAQFPAITVQCIHFKKFRAQHCCIFKAKLVLRFSMEFNTRTFIRASAYKSTEYSPLMNILEKEIVSIKTNEKPAESICPDLQRY